MVPICNLMCKSEPTFYHTTITEYSIDDVKRNSFLCWNCLGRTLMLCCHTRVPEQRDNKTLAVSCTHLDIQVQKDIVTPKSPLQKGACGVILPCDNRGQLYNITTEGLPVPVPGANLGQRRHGVTLPFCAWVCWWVRVLCDLSALESLCMPVLCDSIILRRPRPACVIRLKCLVIQIKLFIYHNN